MNAIDMEIFLTIVSKRNITKAAEILHFSQSTVSHRLKLLEEELETKLFYRRKGSRYIELTMQGEKFVPIAERWLALHREAHSLKSRPNISITIGTIDSLSNTVLPEVFKQVIKNKIPIRLQICTHQSAQIFDLIENRTIDIGFVSIPFERQNISITPFIKQKYYVVRYCKNPSQPRKIHPNSLDPRYEIFQSWGQEYDKWHDYWWGPPIHPHIWVDTISLLYHFLTDERYWTIINEASLKLLMQMQKNLQIDELTDPPPDRICYIAKHRYPKSGSIRGIRILEKYLKKYFNV